MSSHHQSRALRIVQDFFPKVEEVKDARKNLAIKVTEQDVKQGKKKGHIDCVMAIACRRAPNATGVVAALKTLYVIKGTEAIRYKVPENISREIVVFDRGGSFMPGEYELKAPTKRERLGVSVRPGGKRPYKKITKRYRSSAIRSVLGSKMV